MRSQNAADVSSVTVRNFENEKATPQRSTLAAMRRALETAGVIFVEENGEGPGVRLRKTKMSNEPIYVDASRRAVLTHGAMTVDCFTLQEAKLAFDRLSQDRQEIATIVSSGKTYSAQEIRRLHYGPKPGSGARDATIPVED